MSILLPSTYPDPPPKKKTRKIEYLLENPQKNIFASIACFQHIINTITQYAQAPCGMN